MTPEQQAEMAHAKSILCVEGDIERWRLYYDDDGQLVADPPEDDDFQDTVIWDASRNDWVLWWQR